MDMDRAERHKRYGGGGSRASSPSKRSRPPSDYQRDALESVDDDDNYVSDWWGENDDGRTAAWVEAAAAGDREDEPRGRKRKRTEEGLLPSLTSSFSCQASHNEPSPPAPASAPGQPSPTSVDTSKKSQPPHGRATRTAQQSKHVFFSPQPAPPRFTSSPATPPIRAR